MNLSLNNRHKTGLFLTTLVAGLCLILGETVRETIGAIIIGFALTWAFGCTSRVLRYCIGGLGALLFLVPLIAGLIDHQNAMQDYELTLAAYHTQLPQFAKDHPDLSAGLIPRSFSPNDPYTVYGGAVAKQPTEWDANGNPISTGRDPIAKKHGGVVLDFSKAQPINRTLAVPNTGNVSFPLTMSDKDIAKALRADSGNNRAPDWYLEALDAGVSPEDISQLTPPLDKPKAFDLKHVLSDGFVIEAPSLVLAILFFGSVIVEAKRSISHSDKPVES